MIKPGIQKRIGQLSTLLVHGGHVGRVVELAKDLVGGRRRPGKCDRATRELARELLPHVIRERKVLAEAERYLLACLTKKEARDFNPPSGPSEREEVTGGGGEQGC